MRHAKRIAQTLIIRMTTHDSMNAGMEQIFRYLHNFIFIAQPFFCGT